MTIASLGNVMRLFRRKNPTSSNRTAFFVPEPIYHPISKPPEKPPFRVLFTLKGFDAGENPVLNRVLPEMRRRLTIHFGKPMWVHSNGMMGVPPDNQYFDKCPKVELQIDASGDLTTHCSLALPREVGRIEKLDSGFPCDPWRLYVTKADNPNYHDQILFHKGTFLLNSVLLTQDKLQRQA